MSDTDALISALTIFGLILAVLTILVPFFIFKIRNQVIQINHKMTDIIVLLRSPGKVPVVETDWEKQEL